MTEIRLSFAVVVAMTTVLSVPPDARAGAMYSASTSDGPSTGGSSPVSSDGNLTFNTGEQVGFNAEAAVASVGSVGAGIFGEWQSFSLPNSPISVSDPTATAAANFTVDDVVFGTNGGGSITTSLNLHLKGSMSPGLFIQPSDTPNTAITASSTIMVTVDVTQGVNFYMASGLFGVSATGTASTRTGAVSSSGLFSNFLTQDPNTGVWGSNGDLTTGSFTVTAGSPVTVSVGFSATTQATGTVDTEGGSDAIFENTIFLNTLSFATDAPVFNLPAGDIVNSVEGNIVSNRYIVVPEPSTILLLGTALVSLGFIRRRKASSSLL